MGDRMLDSVYEKTLKKRDGFFDEMNKTLNNLEDVSTEKWIDFGVPENSLECIVSAGDGSFNKKEYLSFALYAVAAECIVYDGNSLDKVESSDVDVIGLSGNLRDRLRNYMGIFESKTHIKTLDNFDVDLVLFDGSIFGNLIRPPVFRSMLDDEIKKTVESFYLKDLKKKIASEEKVRITSSDFFPSIIKNFGDNHLKTEIYLESLENLLSLSDLIKKGNNILSISKTSTRNDYFDSHVPDIAVFDNLSKKEGYSKPIYLDVSSAIKRKFPIENKNFRKMNFTVFYARLEEFKNILKLEIPFKATTNDIEELLCVLKSISVEGYPYLLKKAHNEVVIKNKDMETLEKIFDLRGRNGREMLS